MSIVFDENDPVDRRVSSLKGRGRTRTRVVQEAGRAMEEIQGVVSARVEASPGGEVEEVHVVARGGRKAKEIVRDVETLLKAKFDLAIDHRKISVARLGESTEAATEPQPSSRLSFSGVSLHLSREGSEAQVELARGGQRWVGSASSRGIEPAWPRLVAEATLDAVSQLLPSGLDLELSGVTSASVADREVVLLRVSFRGDRQDRELFGCATVAGDRQRSVVFATLHALNRFLGRYSGSCQRELILEPPQDA